MVDIAGVYCFVVGNSSLRVLHSSGLAVNELISDEFFWKIDSAVGKLRDLDMMSEMGDIHGMEACL